LLQEDADHAYTIFEADSSQAALEYCRSQRLDCILLDYHLPDYDGLELLDKLHSETTMVPIAVVMLTGVGDANVATRAMKSGAGDYLVKGGLTAGDLQRAIDNAIEKMALQQEIEAQRRELERSNRDLEEFAHVVSHDLKAPLRAISTLATWIAQDYASVLDEPGREYLRLLVGRTQRMNNLIEGILQYSRAGRQDSTLTRFDSAIAVRYVIDLLAPPPNIPVRVVEPLPEIVYEPTQFEQVVQNLLSNGIKHLGKPAGEIVVSCSSTERFWRFSVRDNGVGIPEKHFDRIFKIFQTLKSKDEFESTGVGLSVVQKIVEHYGGMVQVRSVLGEGSEFSFTIPKDLTAGRTN
jgi:light-regulated signal transduction histidine kinase (bacteriophytochrome)